MGDSPRLLSQPVHRLPTYCSPSTSFASNPILDMQLTNSLLTSPLFRQPPPYSRCQAHHPTHQDLFRMHNTPVIVEPDTEDVDVVSISDSTKEVSLNDPEEEKINQKEQPLDLTTSRASTVSPVSRASVIISGKPNRPIQRSSSSVSSIEPDVHEHFRRSLSGKWPRRAKTEEEKGRASPMRRHTSYHSATSGVGVQASIINSDGSGIEEHFRRALGDQFQVWLQKREALEKAESTP